MTFTPIALGLGVKSAVRGLITDLSAVALAKVDYCLK